MSSIPLPALQIKQQEQPDMLGTLGRLAALKQGQLENQSRQLQNQQMQSDLDSQKAFTRAYQETQGDPQATVQKALQYGAKPQFVDGWIKSRAELDKITEEGHEKHLKNLSDGYGLIGQQAQAILTLPPEQRGQAIQQAIGNMIQGKGLDPAYGKQLLQMVPQDPEGQQTWLQYHALSAMSAKDQVDLKLNQRKTDAEEWKDAGPGQLINTRTGETRGNLRQPVDQQELSDWMAKNPGKGPADFMKAKATLVPQFKFQMGGDARDQARSDKSYQFHSGQLDKVGKPVEDAVTRLGRLQDTLAQNSPQADALVAPELLTVMAGGQGSGLRMNEAEISRIVGGRSNWETLKASINKWSTDPSKANSITPSQRQQIRSLVGVVAGKLQAKQKVMDDARQSLINTNDPEEHKRILYEARKKLSDIDAQAGGGVQVTDPRGVVHTFPDQASADKFKNLAGIQ